MATMANMYYVKALANFPWNLEEVVENLNYALSYDEEHAGANYLMGVMNMWWFADYSEAQHYFELALLYDEQYPETYATYAYLLILIEAYDRAEMMINKGMAVKGVDKYNLLYLQALVFEHKDRLKKTIKQLKLTKKFAFNSTSTAFIEQEIKRVEGKLGKTSTKRKKKKKQPKKSKKKKAKK